MGKYVNNNIVNLGNYGDAIEYTTAVREIANLLGVGKRNDGKFYLSDICKVGSINPLARFKPIRSEKNANITENDRDAVSYGFGETPRIEPYTSGIPHGVYEYKKPRGSEVSPIEWYRLRDFHGYNHIAVSPLQVSFPDSVMIEEENVFYCIGNNSGVSGWDAESCLMVHEMVDETTRGCNVGLLVHNGSNLWLMPSDIKVRDLSPSNFPIFLIGIRESVFTSGTTQNTFKYILGELQNSEGSEYTFAFVATSLGYKTNMSPIRHIDGIPTMRSLELTYNADRKTIEVISTQTISGVSGYLATQTWNYTTANDPSGMTGFKVVKPSESQRLTVRVSTPSSWRRSNVYINVQMQGMYGYIYHNGNMVNGFVDVGKYVDIGADSTADVDILSNFAYPNQYWFGYATSAGMARVQFVITAWRNSEMTGESIELQRVYVDFPNK